MMNLRFLQRKLEVAGTIVESNIVQVTGFERPIDVRVVGGLNTKLSVNYAEFTDEPQFVDDGDYLQIQTEIPDFYGFSFNVFVGIGGTSAQWQISTTDNQGPTVDNPLPDLDLTVGDVVYIPLADVFEDPEGHTLYYNLHRAPQSLSIQDGVIVGELTLNDVGQYSVFLEAKDGLGGGSFDRFTITVSPNTLRSPGGRKYEMIVDDEGNLGTEEKQ